MAEAKAEAKVKVFEAQAEAKVKVFEAQAEAKVFEAKAEAKVFEGRVEVSETHLAFTKYQLHNRTVELLKAFGLLSMRGLIEYVEKSMAAENGPAIGGKRQSKWKKYFSDEEEVMRAVKAVGYNNADEAANEVVTMYRSLSDEVHHLNARRFIQRFGDGALVFGAPLNLRQAELLVCIGMHVGLKCVARGVLDREDMLVELDECKE